jgi:hypothetical protein
MFTFSEPKTKNKNHKFEHILLLYDKKRRTMKRVYNGRIVQGSGEREAGVNNRQKTSEREWE